jgi:hypothetical protein
VIIVLICDVAVKLSFCFEQKTLARLPSLLGLGLSLSMILVGCHGLGNV